MNVDTPEAVPFTPSKYICDEINRREWTIRQFADAAKIEIELAIRIVSGQQRIGRGIAIPIARAFNAPVEFWENLQCSYDVFCFLRPDMEVNG